MTATEGTADLQRSLYRASGWIRGLLALHALLVNLMRLEQARHPVLLVLISLIVIGWTATASLVDQEVRRRGAMMIADVLVTLALISSSSYILGGATLRQTFFDITCYWMVGAPAMIALWRGPVWGALTGLLVGVASFGQAPSLEPRAWTDLLFMVLVPWFTGVLADQITRAVTDRDRSYATAIALGERERLNRIVHDGVLQVLALVEREGKELGPRGQMLALLARKQEVQLRALLQDKSVDLSPAGYVDASQTDVATMLEKHQTDTVTVSTMAGRVEMPARQAQELNAAVTEVLSNVAKHAGPEAKAWVLLEQEGDDLIISIRDNGKGLDVADVQRATANGHVGMQRSIVGRIKDLGGTAVVRSRAGQGVEWELQVPLRPTQA